MSARHPFPNAGTGRTAPPAPAARGGFADISADPATPDEMPDAEVFAVAQMAEAYRDRAGLTNEAFIKRFRSYVQDSKGWHLIRKVPMSQWDRTALRESVRGLRAAVLDADRAAGNPLIETPLTRALGKALELLRRQRSAQRFVFLLGPTGSGKTSCLDYAARRLVNGRKVVRLCGTEGWKSPRQFLADWGKALGVAKLRESCAAAHDQIGEALVALGDALIFVDEAHRLTGTLINMLTDWSNRLAAEEDNAVHFVLAGVGTLWSKLERAAREEADQLRVNRGLDEITLFPPDAEEVSALLAAGCQVREALGADYGTFLAKVTALCATSGSRACVRDIRGVLAGHAAPTLATATAIADAVAARKRLAR